MRGKTLCFVWITHSKGGESLSLPLAPLNRPLGLSLSKWDRLDHF
jgi:hypothetical protein